MLALYYTTYAAIRSILDLILIREGYDTACLYKGTFLNYCSKGLDFPLSTFGLLDASRAIERKWWVGDLPDSSERRRSLIYGLIFMSSCLELSTAFEIDCFHKL